MFDIWMRWLDNFGGFEAFALAIAIWMLSYFFLLNIFKYATEPQRRALAIGTLMVGLLIGHAFNWQDILHTDHFNTPAYAPYEQQTQSESSAGSLSLGQRLLLALITAIVTYAIARSWAMGLWHSSHPLLIGISIGMALLSFYLSGFVSLPAVLALIFVIAIIAYYLRTRFLFSV